MDYSKPIRFVVSLNGQRIGSEWKQVLTSFIKVAFIKVVKVAFYHCLNLPALKDANTGRFTLFGGRRRLFLDFGLCFFFLLGWLFLHFDGRAGWG